MEKITSPRIYKQNFTVWKNAIIAMDIDTSFASLRLKVLKRVAAIYKVESGIGFEADNNLFYNPGTAGKSQIWNSQLEPAKSPTAKDHNMTPAQSRLNET